jgi:CRISPR/Cas system CSM-associated protein Csm2 small subunit
MDIAGLFDPKYEKNKLIELSLNRGGRNLIRTLIRDEDEEALRNFAFELAFYLVDRQLGSSQISQVFGSFKKHTNRLKSEFKVTGLSRYANLRKKVRDAAYKDGREGTLALVAILFAGLDEITAGGSLEKKDLQIRFARFARLFDAILAFHKEVLS